MAVTQTADKITTVMIAVTPEMAVVGTAIRKGMLKLQNADGKTEGMALPAAIMMMTGDTAAAHLGTVITMMTTGGMDAPADGLHTTTTKIVVEILHAAAVAIMMMTTEVTDMVDGLATLRVIQRQHARAGKTGDAITVVVITTEAIAAAVATEAAIAMMMIRVGVGMGILKVIPRQLTEVGKIVDIKKSANVSRNIKLLRLSFFW
jgi:hypothetical protein